MSDPNKAFVEKLFLADVQAEKRKPRVLTLTLAQIKKVLSRYGIGKEFLNSILDDLCQVAKVETPRDILRARKRGGGPVPQTSRSPQVGDKVTVTYGFTWDGEGEIVDIFTTGVYKIKMFSGEKSGNIGGFTRRDFLLKN